MITSCKDLMLAAFRICMFQGDLSPLGEGAREDQEAAWLAVRSEYYVLLKDDGVAAMIEQRVDFNALASQIERMEVLIAACREVADDDLAGMLRDEGYMLELPETDDDAAYQRQLNVIAAKLAPLKMRLASMLRYLPAEVSPEDEAKKIEESGEGFEVALVEASRFMGFPVNEETTTVYRFCKMLARRADQIKAHNTTTLSNA